MPTDDQREIAATVASYLADRVPAAGRGEQHVLESPELEDSLWEECAGLGWLGLGLPEQAGGVGYGLAEEVMLFRELGRGVAPGGFLPSVLAARVAMGARLDELVAAMVNGSQRVAMATAAGPATIGPRVVADLSLTHIDGASIAVICDDQGAALIDIGNAEIERVDCVDGTVSSGRCRIDAHAVGFVAASDDPIFDRGLVLAAATSVGLAEASQAIAVRYAGDRIQFGKPIGSNQAIKHRCSDMAVRSEGAFAQACYAAVAVRDGLDGASAEAAIAKYIADEAARLNSEGAVHIHGAIGFTSEATPYLFVQRGHVLARTLASRVALLDRVIGRGAVTS